MGGGTNVDELARIQTALDARYASRDVRHTFESYFGELVDCVDYYAQPGARALMAEGRPVPTPQGRALGATERAALPDFVFNGKPDSLGRPRACPDGTVPMLRVTVDDIRAAGGLDAAKKMHSHKPPPQREGLLNPCIGDGSPLSGHAHVTQNFTGGTNITSTISTTSVYTPSVSQSGSKFSLSQTWTSTGSGYNLCGETCTTDCYQTVEAGWVVYPTLFSTKNPTSPHLFTFATGDGYLHGCWNGVDPNPPASSKCLKFLVSPQAVLLPGATLPSSARGGAQVELQIRVNHSAADGWCLTAGIVPNVLLVGCWPNSEFSGSMQTAAARFQVGAEIASGTSVDYFIPMGSGAAPSSGFGQAAYHRDYAANGSASFKPGLFIDKLSYGMAINPAAGGNWGTWFYFGSEPLTGWASHSLLLID